VIEARRIVALTPNLAIDRTLTLDRGLEPGTLHRVRQVREAAGGKGVNLTRAVRALGGEGVVAGPVTGFNGRKFAALLQSEGLRGALTELPGDGETRQCTIVVDNGPYPTEINEPGPEVGLETWASLLAGLPEGRRVVSGSLPPGSAKDAFVALLARAGGPFAVDTHGAALVAAVRAGPEGGVDLVKPNRRELVDAAEQLGLGADRDEPYALAVAIQRRYGVRVLMSRGSEGALLVGAERWIARAPRVEVVNPVGSGDAMLGAFLVAEESGSPPDRALALAVAAGADNARRGGGRLDPEAVRSMARSVPVERLP